MHTFPHSHWTHILTPSRVCIYVASTATKTDSEIHLLDLCWLKFQCHVQIGAGAKSVSPGNDKMYQDSDWWWMYLVCRDCKLWQSVIGFSAAFNRVQPPHSYLLPSSSSDLKYMMKPKMVWLWWADHTMGPTVSDCCFPLKVYTVLFYKLVFPPGSTI